MSVPFIKQSVLLLLWLSLVPFLLNFLEITLMESDTLSDDLVETKTFDLTSLELNKAYQKTFVFHQVTVLNFPALSQKTCNATQRDGKPRHVFLALRYLLLVFFIDLRG